MRSHPNARFARARVRTAGEHGDVMAALLKEVRQHAAHLAAAAGHDDAQRREQSLSQVACQQRNALDR